MKSFALLFFRRIFAVPNEGTRGVAQLASASGLGPEGPVFESQYPDKESNYRLIVAFFCITLASHRICLLTVVHEIKRFCGRDVKNATPVHEIKRFCGRDVKNATYVHEISRFCGRDVKNTTSIHRIRRFCGRDVKNTTSVHRIKRFCGQYMFRV